MSSRLSSIDALRGLAALWVFAYHLWNALAPAYSPQGHPRDHVSFAADTPAAVVVSYPLCAYGYTGVGLFFVLSGFCIHLPQARRFHRKGDDDLKPREFFRRRFWRLYPAYAASLLLGAAGLAAMGGVAPQIAQYVLVNAAFLLAVKPDALSLGPVYWTLWYEVQFYLLYPLLLKVVRRVGFGPVALVLLGCELAFALLPVPDALKPVAPHFEWVFLRRYFEWFLGMWLAERVASGRFLPRSVGMLIAVGGAVVGVVGSHTPALWPVHELFLAVASFGVVAVAVAPRTEAEPGWFRRQLVRLGDCSYSLYLIHMPMMRLIYATADRVAGDAAGWVFAAASVVLVPTTAWVWYRLFEKPFLPQSPDAPKTTTTEGRTGLPLVRC
jgi:peptidoglycan/LPS O-acetylase OafA/YrhL